MTEKKGKQAIMNPEAIRDISEAVYRRKLDAECGEGTAKQTDDDIAAGVLGPDGRIVAVSGFGQCIEIPHAACW